MDIYSTLALEIGLMNGNNAASLPGTFCIAATWVRRGRRAGDRPSDLDLPGKNGDW
jgi:hypothetical protein